MGIDTIIVPKQVDLSQDVDNVTLVYDYTSSSTEKKKLQLSEEVNKTFAETNLRLTVLEVESGISGATDDFSEIFEDADGLLNTVITSETSSDYDSTNKLYINQITETQNNRLSVDSGPFLIFNTWTSAEITIGENEGIITSINFSARREQSNSANYSTRINILDSLDNVLCTTVVSVYRTNNDAFDQSATFSNWSRHLIPGEKIRIQFTPDEFTYKLLIFDYNFTGPQILNSVILETSGSMIKSSSSDIFIFFKAYIPNNKEITLNYDSINPVGCSLQPFSNGNKQDEIGNITFELIHTATGETTGELEPLVINTSISMTNTPDKMVIHQKDTDLSKITKFVLLLA